MKDRSYVLGVPLASSMWLAYVTSRFIPRVAETIEYVLVVYGPIEIFWTHKRGNLSANSSDIFLVGGENMESIFTQ